MGYCLINYTRSDELNLDYLGRTIEIPQAKTNYIEVPLSDGMIDLSYALSPIMRYATRQINIRFELRLPRIQWQTWMAEFCKKYHGMPIRISFDDDPDYYWSGRASVGMLEDHNSTAGITLTINAEPFKRTVSALIDMNVEFTNSQTRKEIVVDLKSARGYVTINAYSLASGGIIQVLYNDETFNLSADNSRLDLVMNNGGDDTIVFISNNPSNICRLIVDGGEF